VLGVFRREEGALMVIEPPGQPRIARILEIHDGILIAIEQAVLEQLGRLVRHPRIAELRIRVNCARDKAAEVGGGGCAVETVVVVQHAFQHGRIETGKPLSLPESGKKCKSFLKKQESSNCAAGNLLHLWETHARHTRLGPILSADLPGGGGRSKDPNTQIGCVVVGPNHEIRSTGYNSFPRGIRDDVPERLVRPTKYLWIEHAERNAICNAARAGTATEGCTIYVEIMPCMDCARAIVQAGIVQVVVSAERMAQYSSEYYNQHFGMTEVLFGEARVKVRRV
jgi:dCMP deaminase